MNKNKYKQDYKTDDEAWFTPAPDLQSKNDVEVKFVKLNQDAKMPERANATDAGWDLFSSEEVVWNADEPQCVPTGLAMVLPEGWEAQVRPRSGLSLRGWTVCNSPGTIDAGYRGELMVILKPNCLNAKMQKGVKMAQLVFKRVPKVSVKEITQDEFKELNNTSRGTGGFGSTGL